MSGRDLGNGLRLGRLIGEGAMGVVYEARDTSGRRVAVKLMTEHLAADPEQRRRFEREARALAKLSSPHAVRVLDVGTTSDGATFYSMELLEGRSLMTLVEGEGPLPFARAVALVRSALDAIGEAHAAGLVHRDIKPDNLFLTNDGVVKVLDFGIVKDLASRTAQQTRTGDAMGTPAYMAPEQVRTGEPVDARTDVWAIGATLYELVTGDIPFRGASVAKILQGILDDPPAPIGRPDVPAELEAVIRKCLAKNKDERYASARDLDDALAPFAPARKRSRRPAVERATPGGAANRVVLFFVPFVVVLVATGAAFALWIRSRPGPVAPTPRAPPPPRVEVVASADASDSAEPAPPMPSASASATPKAPHAAPTASSGAVTTAFHTQTAGSAGSLPRWAALHDRQLWACGLNRPCAFAVIAHLDFGGSTSVIPGEYGVTVLDRRTKLPHCKPPPAVVACVLRELRTPPEPPPASPDCPGVCDYSLALSWDDVRN